MAVKQKKTKRQKMLRYAKKMLRYVVTDDDLKIVIRMVQNHSRNRFRHKMKVTFDGSKMPRVGYEPVVKGVIVKLGPKHASVKTKKYGMWLIPYEQLSPR